MLYVEFFDKSAILVIGENERVGIRIDLNFSEKSVDGIER